MILVWVAAAFAAPWSDVTESAIGETEGWTNKVTLADLNGDGQLDLLFANGGNYASAGDPELSQVFFNQGDGTFEDVSAAVFGDTLGLTRAIKAADFDGDGNIDLFLANTYQTPSVLLLGDGTGGFEDHSDQLPAGDGSFGDAEAGDVDGDGDLDLGLADWGSGNPLSNEGGSIVLWINDGGVFTDAPMPEVPRGMSWDMEWVDVDNDADLDGLMSCKVCDGGVLLKNDGSGNFIDASEDLPQASNNYDYEPMDVDGDGDLDLVTINDGDGLGETILENTGGSFTDRSADWWPSSENLGLDDNVAVFLDYDSDGDADLLIGSLSEPDRLLLNDGAGGLSLVAEQVLDGDDSYGTLGMAVGDLNADGRPDVVMSQGEVDWPERVFFGVDAPVDTGAPVAVVLAGEPGERVVARVHDHHSPSTNVEFALVELEWVVGDETETAPLTWAGEFLWQAVWPADAESVRVCATDAAGNSACSAWFPEDETPDTDADTDASPPQEGCGCQTGPTSSMLWLVVGWMGLRRRKT